VGDAARAYDAEERETGGADSGDLPRAPGVGRGHRESVGGSGSGRSRLVARVADREETACERKRFGPTVASYRKYPETKWAITKNDSASKRKLTCLAVYAVGCFGFGKANSQSHLFGSIC
jgi:hypothetical protein